VIIAELLEKIKAKTGFQPRMSGGQYIFRCPCHEDRSPSASARVANNGAILLHCYAGCPIEGICNAIGIEPKDLFPSSASLPAPTAAPPRKAYDTLEEAIKAAEWGVGKRNPGAKLAKAWPYRDPDGNRYACQVRFEHPGGKTFAMISRISGGWALCGPERRWPLGCEKLGEPVHVVEGEKCVYALRAETGWSVTTSLGGSQSAQKTDWSCVAGKHVYIWPDNDDAGRKYAQTVAGILSGLNCEVYEVSIPGLAPGGDIADWLAERDSLDGEEIKNQLADFVAKARRVSTTVEAAPDSDCRTGRPRPQGVHATERGTDDDPPEPPPLAAEIGDAASETALGRLPELKIVQFADLRQNPEPEQEWVLDGLIPSDNITLLGGHGGTGKSLFLLEAAAHIAMGEPFLGRRTAQGTVVYFSAEDGASMIRRRLGPICDAFGFDPAIVAERLVIVDGQENSILYEGDDQKYGNGGKTTGVYAALTGLIDETKAAVLIIDNASDCFDGDENKRREVRAFLKALWAAMKPSGGALVLLVHTNKTSARAKDKSTENYSGSTAWHNSARSRLALLRDSDAGDGRMVLRHEKCNLGRLADSVLLEFRDGTIQQVFEDSTSALGDEKAILLMITEFNERGELLYANSRSPGNAFKVLSSEPGFPRRINRSAFDSVMRNLQRRGLVEVVTERTAQRRTVEIWRVTPAARGASGRGGES